MKSGYNQLPLMFNKAGYIIYKPDYMKDGKYAIPDYILVQAREENKLIIVYSSWSDEVQILNVFEGFVDSIDVTKMSKTGRTYQTYHLGSYELYHHLFKADKEEDKTQLLTTTERKLLARFDSTWYNSMKDVIDSNILRGATKVIKEERLAGEIIFPSQEQTFRAFSCNLYNVRIVLVGQD